MSTCIKCGKTHGTGVVNRENGEFTPTEKCYDCMFIATYQPITSQISFDDLPDPCDKNILQREMSETMNKIFVGEDE